jgi:hypothetical protein
VAAPSNTTLKHALGFGLPNSEHFDTTWLTLPAECQPHTLRRHSTIIGNQTEASAKLVA